MAHCHIAEHIELIRHHIPSKISGWYEMTISRRA
jgi:hypothetical protein